MTFFYAPNFLSYQVKRSFGDPVMFKIAKEIYLVKYK